MLFLDDLQIQPIQSQEINDKHDQTFLNMKENDDKYLVDQDIITQNLWRELVVDAQQKSIKEPILASFFFQNILNHTSLAKCLTFLLATKLGNRIIAAVQWSQILSEIFQSNPQLAIDMRDDLLLVKEKDAAWTSHIHTLLYLKGFAGLCLARISQQLYQQDRKELAFIIQNRNSELFGMDIHPRSVFEGGIFFDHASGLVIGETASIGRGTVILHNVTLGATGKEPHGSDRHPKIGRNCYIGSNVTILGNIKIGENVKIGAGTVCLKDIPPNKTAVGAPARIL